MEGARHAVVGRLDEPAKMLTETAGKKQTGLIERNIVVRTVVGGGRLSCLGAEVGRHRHDRERRTVGGPKRVTHELELPSERRELWSEAAHMACIARLAGLVGEGRHGGGGSGEQRARS